MHAETSATPSSQCTDPIAGFSQVPLHLIG